jgi:deoxycytidylate deaminase
VKKEALRALARSKMYVFRYKYVAGEYLLANSKPCFNCLNLIKQSGIKKIYYSISSYENGVFKSGIMVERVRDMETAHVSFGDR